MGGGWITHGASFGEKGRWRSVPKVWGPGKTGGNGKVCRKAYEKIHHSGVCLQSNLSGG